MDSKRMLPQMISLVLTMLVLTACGYEWIYEINDDTELLTPGCYAFQALAGKVAQPGFMTSPEELLSYRSVLEVDSQQYDMEFWEGDLIAGDRTRSLVKIDDLDGCHAAGQVGYQFRLFTFTRAGEHAVGSPAYTGQVENVDSAPYLGVYAAPNVQHHGSPWYAPCDSNGTVSDCACIRPTVKQGQDLFYDIFWEPEQASFQQTVVFESFVPQGQQITLQSVSIVAVKYPPVYPVPIDPALQHFSQAIGIAGLDSPITLQNCGDKEAVTISVVDLAKAREATLEGIDWFVEVDGRCIDCAPEDFKVTIHIHWYSTFEERPEG